MDYSILLQSHGSVSGVVASPWRQVGGGGRGVNQVKRTYDPALHGFCYIINSNSVVHLSYNNTKASSWSSVKHHKFLVLQLYLPSDAQKIWIELGTTDSTQSGLRSSKYATKRRIFLSNLVKSVNSTPLHSNVPITQSFPRNQWTSLVIDLSGLTNTLYKNCCFKTLDSVAIQGHQVKLRSVYTCKHINSFTFIELQSSIPTSLAFPFTLKDQHTFVLLNGHSEMSIVSNPLTTQTEFSLSGGLHHTTLARNRKKHVVPKCPTFSSLSAKPTTKLPPLTVDPLPTNTGPKKHSRPCSSVSSKSSFTIPCSTSQTTTPSKIPQSTLQSSTPLHSSSMSMLPQPTQFRQHSVNRPIVVETPTDIEMLDLEVSHVVMKALNKAKLDQERHHPTTITVATSNKSPIASLENLLHLDTEQSEEAADDSLVELTYDTSIGAYVDQLSGQCFQIDSY